MAMGTYVTLEAPNMAHPDEDYHEEIARELADQIKSLLPKKKEQLSILIVGLGNREVTADSLGPRVVDNLTITRHMVMEFGMKAVSYLLPAAWFRASWRRPGWNRRKSSVVWWHRPIRISYL